MSATAVVRPAPAQARIFERVPELDGLHGLAITLVLFMHFGRAPADLWGGALEGITGMGWIGVDLSFVPSGFLITGILLDTKGQPGYYRSFYWRRAPRILPLRYELIALILLLPRSTPLATWVGAPYLADHQAWFWTHTVNWLIASKGANDIWDCIATQSRRSRRSNPATPSTSFTRQSAMRLLTAGLAGP